VAGSAVAAGLEEGHWLCPVEDRRRIDSRREGMIEGFSLGNYVLLVDYTARLYPEEKATLSRELAEILDRLKSRVDQWQARLEKLRQGTLLGRFFATSRQRLREVAERLGLRRVPNVGGCPLTCPGPESGPRSLGNPNSARRPCALRGRSPRRRVPKQACVAPMALPRPIGRL